MAGGFDEVWSFSPFRDWTITCTAYIKRIYNLVNIAALIIQYVFNGLSAKIVQKPDQGIINTNSVFEVNILC